MNTRFFLAVLGLMMYASAVISAPAQTGLPIQVIQVTTSNPLSVESQALMAQIFKQGLSIVSQKNLTPEAKLEKLRPIVTPYFDFNLMTKLAVGKEYWTQLSELQQSQLTEAFKAYLQDLYLVQLVNYKNQTILIHDPSISNGRVAIDVDVKDRDSFFRMTYKIYKKSGYMVYDVDVKGISTIQTFSKQFRPYLVAHKFEDLLRVLKTK